MKANKKQFIKTFAPSWVVLAVVLISLFSINGYSMEPDEAQNLIKLNLGTFNPKQLMLNKDLCNFHNQLVKDASPKHKNEALNCGRNEGSKVDNESLQVQLKNLNSNMIVIDAMHPDSEEINSDSILNHAKQKMKNEGFGR